MNIGFDAKRYLRNNTGLGNYSRTLVNSLADHNPDQNFFLFSDKNYFNNPYLRNDLPNLKPVYPSGILKGGIYRSFMMNSALKSHKIDVYHGLSHEIPFAASVPTVVTMHDVLHKRLPDQYRYADRNIYDLKMAYACKKASIIVAISQATKSDLIKYFKVKPDRIKVVYQGVSSFFSQVVSDGKASEVKEKYRLPNKYLLYVGSIIKRKRLLQAVKALYELRYDFHIPLVVVGSGGDYFTLTKEFIKSKGMESQVIFLNELSNSDLPALYRSAEIFLYPSVAEGFGIPLIEAFSQQTPVITSKFSSLAEVSNGAALEVDPDNLSEFATAIRSLLSNDTLRSELIAKGNERYAFFNSDNQAKEMMEIYRALAQ